MTEHIFLTGFMGTGKTTVSKELARLLQVEEIDTDQELEKRLEQKISTVFANQGEAYFREKETMLIKELEDKKGCVVSCGGGVVLRQENVESMKKSGVVVLLNATPKTILGRVRHKGNRPLLKGNMNLEYIEGMLQERMPFYEKAADVVVDTDGKLPKDIAQEILEQLKNG